MDESLFITALIGIFSAIITQLSKKSGIGVKYLLVIPVFFFATGYVLFFKYTPTHLATELIETGSKILASAVLFYEFILVRVMKKFPLK